MEESSAQSIKAQVKQARQSARVQAASQIHPPANVLESNYTPPLPPIPTQAQAPPEGVIMSGNPINMGLLSLTAVSLCLMMLGAFTFLGGFLLGIWFSGPTTTYPVNNFAQQQGISQIPTEVQEAQSLVDQASAAAQGLKSGLANIGFGQIASGQARNITQNAVGGVTVPGVPDFLAPLVTSTQVAIGQQLGFKAQQQVGQQMNQVQSVPTPPQMAPVPSQPSPSRQTPSAAPSGPVPSQQGVKANDDGYSIQLGVFAAADNAQALVNHLHGLNYPSQVIEGKSQDGSSLYYVRSGLFNDYKTATEAATQFASRNIPGALIVKVSQSKKGGS